MDCIYLLGYGLEGLTLTCGVMVLAGSGTGTPDTMGCGLGIGSEAVLALVCLDCTGLSVPGNGVLLSCRSCSARRA